MRILRCRECSEYSISSKCSKCGGGTRVITPPKYSPQDPYGKYRRMMKEEMEYERR
mgnify:CR=1 FL=1